MIATGHGQSEPLDLAAAVLIGLPNQRRRTGRDGHEEKIDFGQQPGEPSGERGALTLNAGISCLIPDAGEDNTLYLCNRHGIFKTTDNGKSYRLVKGVEN